MVEFLSGVNRLTTAAYKETNNPFSKQQQKTIVSLKKKSKLAPIYPLDKTKRLIAQNNDDYEQMLRNCLNKDNPTVRTNLPSTTQSNFNLKLRKISEKYKNQSIYTKINNCKSSEPLPSYPYALVKDHKEGELKGRPIISTVSSVVRPLSKFIAKILNPMVKEHVESYLQSSQEFISSLQSVNTQTIIFLGSFDVKNLYGSIPLLNFNAYPGLLEVVTKFYDQFKSSSRYPELATNDFHDLLELCLFSDTYLLNGVSRKQSKGIAMGNCAALPLSILYMNIIED